MGCETHTEPSQHGHCDAAESIVLLWCMAAIVNQLPSYVTLHEGLPNIDEVTRFNGPQLVVLDDLMDECSKSPMLNSIFTKYVHHYGMSVIILVQNIFYSNT